MSRFKVGSRWLSRGGRVAKVLHVTDGGVLLVEFDSELGGPTFPVLLQPDGQHDAGALLGGHPYDLVSPWVEQQTVRYKLFIFERGGVMALAEGTPMGGAASKFGMKVCAVLDCTATFRPGDGLADAATTAAQQLRESPDAQSGVNRPL